MKKSLIALATAGAFAAPAAMADVTISGIVDVGIANQSGVGTFLEHGALTDHNELTFHVDEDLGNGLTAIVHLEAGFGQNGNAADGGLTGGGANALGTNVLFSRQTYAGISGNFGTVRAGQILSPQVIAGASNTLGVGQFFVEQHIISGQGLYASPAGTGVQAGNGGFFVPNSIAYSSPDFNGWAINALVQLDAGANDGQIIGRSANDGYWAIHVPGSIGPVSLNFGASSRDGTAAAPGYDSWSAGGSVMLSEQMKVVLGVMSNEDQGAIDEILGINVGLSYDLANGTTLIAQYGQSDMGPNSGPSNFMLRPGTSDPTLINLSAIHSLSPTTKIYVLFTQATEGASSSLANRGNACTTNPGPAVGGTNQVCHDTSNSTFTVGMAKWF